MPPISPQGSRTGIITTLVIFAVLFVVSAILFINENAQRRNAQKTLEQRDQELERVADSGIISTAVPALMESKTNDVWKSVPAVANATTALQVALAQRDYLAKLSAGTDQANAALARVQQAITDATQRATTQPSAINPGDDLSHVVQVLTDRVVALVDETNRLGGELAQSQGNLKRSVADRDAMMKAADEKLAQVQKAANTAIAALEQYRTERTTQVEQLTNDTRAAQEAAQKAASDLQAELAKAQEQIQTSNTMIATYRTRLDPIRVDPTGPTVRAADGYISQVPDQNTVYINLGKGDQLVMGMTFEVYDKLTGVPRVAAAGGENAQADIAPGKASIEVVRVGSGGSEAHVVRRSPGTTIAEGDIIVNLIYDKNVKYNFAVYGDFSLSAGGRANPADTEIIKRLITQWGAKTATPRDGRGLTVQDITPAIDFLVVGAEPEVPPVQAGDSASANNLAEQKRQELKQYQAIVQRAAELSIPILNQNRFLRLIGYYDQVGR